MLLFLTFFFLITSLVIFWQQKNSKGLISWEYCALSYIEKCVILVITMITEWFKFTMHLNMFFIIIHSDESHCIYYMLYIFYIAKYKSWETSFLFLSYYWKKNSVCPEFLCSMITQVCFDRFSYFLYTMLELVKRSSLSFLTIFVIVVAELWDFMVEKNRHMWYDNSSLLWPILFKLLHIVHVVRNDILSSLSISQIFIFVVSELWDFMWKNRLFSTRLLWPI